MIIADHQIVVPWRHLDLVARFVFLGEMNECVRGLAWEILVGYWLLLEKRFKFKYRATKITLKKSRKMMACERSRGIMTGRRRRYGRMTYDM